MSTKLELNKDFSDPILYQIRVEGHLGDEWADWFDGMEIRLEDEGTTLFSGPVVDQADLFGLLRKLRDVGLPLISVMRIEPADIFE